MTLKSNSFLSSIRQTNETISKTMNQGMTPTNFILAIFLFMKRHWDDIFMVVLTMFIAFSVFQIHGLNTQNMNMQKRKLSYSLKNSNLFFPISLPGDISTPDDISFTSIFQSDSVSHEVPDTSYFEFNIPE